MTARLLLNVDADTYHADQLGDTPTLSAGTIRTLLDASPAHAKANHPRLNPAYEKKTEEKFDVGTAAHRLLLEGENAIEVVVADDWRTKVAREHRDEARSHGRIPLLAKDADAVVELAAAIRVQLDAMNLDPTPFTDGEPEQTLLWDEDGIACRARIDWLHTNGDVSDLKTTSRLAIGWDRGPLYDHGCDIQAALYIRGLRKLTGRWPQWTWVVAETAPPYGLIPYRLTGPVLALGDAKVEKALAIWRRCLATNEWPAYARVAVDAELPGWIESRWLEREAREEAIAA